MSSRPIISTVRVKFWFEDHRGRAFFGEGTAKLFEAIDRHKSISVATDRIGMSYRYALHRISIAEQRSGRKLVARFRGGRAKGGAHLTEQGRLFLERYLRAKRVLDELAASI
jgi:molybdate transport system regulatory protein